jgi:molybdopterin-containing oxidoreductase family membrane subunit
VESSLVHHPGTPLALRRVNDDILRTLGVPGRAYVAAVLFLFAVICWGGFAWAYQIRHGLGAAGYNHPVMWAVYITNFVFWVGIAHSGTLISAVLYLLRAEWRTAVARASEAMTVFAVMTAGLFPIIHLGRPWFFYWLFPYPNQRELWVNFRSPLIWDVFAVTTYLITSALFLYLGLLPDLATLRDRTSGLRRWVYGTLSLGWHGTTSEWRHFGALYAFLAALATPLVVSVHSVVSWDFAMAILPGWHSTIFAPYFVAGAILSGLAMVLTLLIPLRRMAHLEEYVTIRHFENLAKLIIVTSLIVTYAYAVEFFVAWYSGDVFERGTYMDRATGAFAPLFWTMVLCNSVIPLSLFFRRVRTDVRFLFAISIAVNIGMWLERFVIIASSLAHDFDPANWAGLYRPTWVEVSITAGSLAWFLFWFLLFVKHFPAVAMSEVKESLVHEASDHRAAGTTA